MKDDNVMYSAPYKIISSVVLEEVNKIIDDNEHWWWKGIRPTAYISQLYEYGSDKISTILTLVFSDDPDAIAYRQSCRLYFTTDLITEMKYLFNRTT